MPRIRVIDFETQGLEPTDKVCETGWCDLANDGDAWRLDRYGASLHRVEAMPPQARAVHHISAADTADFPPFSAPDLWRDAKVDGVNVVASHNVAFDGAFWGEPELPVLCTLKSARRLWPDAPAHGNGVLRYWPEEQGLIAPNPALTLPPHRAGPDAYVTAHLLVAMLHLTSAAQMVAWTKEPLFQPRITFGKHKGEWAAAPRDYLQWILRSDMDADTKWNAGRELERRAVPA